jgi:hypothetical protein
MRLSMGAGFTQFTRTPAGALEGGSPHQPICRVLTGDVTDASRPLIPAMDEVVTALPPPRCASRHHRGSSQTPWTLTAMTR